MAAPIRMPDLGTVESEVTIARWLKAPGETVAAGEALLEVETDKGVNPVESVAGGVVLRRLFEDGARVGAGELIAWVGQPGDPIPGGAAATAPAGPASPAVVAGTGAGAKATPARVGGAPRVSPVVRSLAERYGVDIAALRGTGANGTVTREDVLRAKGGGAPAVAPPAASTPRPAVAGGLTANQAGVARKVAQSHAEKPTFRVTALVDMSAVVAHRETAKAAAGGAPAWDAYLVAAAGRAIAAFPAFRRWMHGGEAREHAAVDVAIAIGTADELHAPVVRGADRKNVAQVADDVAAFAAKARAGALGPADAAESCFLVSNLGMLPIESFDAIVYPQHAAALASGAVAPTPVVRPDGSFTARPMARLTLTVDHRLVNGLAAARFLTAVKDFLEQGAFA